MAVKRYVVGSSVSPPAFIVARCRGFVHGGGGRLEQTLLGKSEQGRDRLPNPTISKPFASSSDLIMTTRDEEVLTFIDDGHRL